MEYIYILKIYSRPITAGTRDLPLPGLPAYYIIIFVHMGSPHLGRLGSQHWIMHAWTVKMYSLYCVSG